MGEGDPYHGARLTDAEGLKDFTGENKLYYSDASLAGTLNL